MPSETLKYTSRLLTAYFSTVIQLKLTSSFNQRFYICCKHQVNLNPSATGDTSAQIRIEIDKKLIIKMYFILVMVHSVYRGCLCVFFNTKKAKFLKRVTIPTFEKLDFFVAFFGTFFDTFDTLCKIPTPLSTF